MTWFQRLRWWRPIAPRPSRADLERDIQRLTGELQAAVGRIVLRDRQLDASRQLAADRGNELARVRAVLADIGLSEAQANNRVRQIVMGGGVDA